jgi:hypothetical protein
MSPTDALNNLIKASAEFKGTKQDHIILEQSGRILKTHLEALEKGSAGGKSEEEQPEKI